MKRLIPLALLALSVPLLAQEDEEQPVTPGTVIDAAPAGDWIEIAPEDMLVMTLAPNADGEKREVVMQLLPPPFSQGWVRNIRRLAELHWWDGTSVYRVQDNWVTQWGGGAVEKEDPEGLEVVPESEYASTNLDLTKATLAKMTEADISTIFGDGMGSKLKQIRDRIGQALKHDAYSERTLYSDGWPLAQDGGTPESTIWATHCYGTIGVARGTDNTGSGSELYVAIGQAPRQLDRNIAVAGRVIEGMQWLSALPRAKAANGFYEDDEADKRVPILSVRLVSELPEAERPRFRYLSTESESFARYAHVSANRSDPFYKVAAGGIDVCNLRVPIKRIEEEDGE